MVGWLVVTLMWFQGMGDIIRSSILIFQNEKGEIIE